MSDCFWTGEIGCYDPTCGQAVVPIYILPLSFGAGGPAPTLTIPFGSYLFTDRAMTAPATATTATITKIDSYDWANISNCEFQCWSSCVIADHTSESDLTSGCYTLGSLNFAGCVDGTDVLSPPRGALLRAYNDLSVSVPVASTPPIAAILAAYPFMGVGSTGTHVCTVETDIGTGIFTFANNACH